MPKELLINVSEGEECRIALLADGKLQELYMERNSSTSHVGNIYKGKVTNVEASIQAAFVDFGLGRNGFLHISDLMPSYFGQPGEDVQESVGRKISRRDRPPIQRCLRRGDEIVVQIIKEGIGTKGPTLSTYLSIPGRILVMMPGMGKMGISRKIEDEQERKRLRQILDGLKPPKDVGFIIRTAGVGKTKTEIERDLKYLTRLWENIEKTRTTSSAPVELYTEGDLVTRTVRDVFASDIDTIIVDNKDVAKKVKDFFKIAMPRTKNKVEIYTEPVPLFHKYGIEREIEQMYSRYVPLPSGGSLVIDSTEAVVAIDVNSGKFRDHSDAETTAFKTDMEAAEEIPRQLKLRDLGGVIICDFIDLRYERHRRELERKLHDAFKKDRAKTKVLRMSQFGIIEITRQRMRPSLKRSIYADCPHCKGSGLIKTSESMSLDVMRRLAIAANDTRVARVELSVCGDVSFHLQNKKRRRLADLEDVSGKRIIVRVNPLLGLDEMTLELFDQRDGLVHIPELGTSAALPAPAQHGQSSRRDQSNRRNNSRPNQGPGRPNRGQDHHGDDRELLAQARHESGDEAREPDTDEEPAPRRDRDDQQARRDRQDRNDRQDRPRNEREQNRSARPPTPANQNDEDDTEASTSQEQEQLVTERDDAPGERPNGRRRGRRGRRGRGQDRSQTEADQSPRDSAPDSDDAVADDDADDNIGNRKEPAPLARSSARKPAEDESSGQDDLESSPRSSHDDSDGNDEAEPPKSQRRGRRGGRRRSGRSGATDANKTTNTEPLATTVAKPATAQPGKKDTDAPPVKPAPVAAPVQQVIAPPVARTGSTDRHLVNDEPVAPQPARRPRSVRDLDAIPDDYD